MSSLEHMEQTIIGFGIGPSLFVRPATSPADRARELRQRILEGVLDRLEQARELADQLDESPLPREYLDELDDMLRAAWDDPIHHQLDFWRQ